MATDIPTKNRKVVALRSAGLCEIRIRSVCRGRAVQLHHRQRRELGDHSPENLLAVCGLCHAAVHAHPEWAREHGFIRSAFTPAEET